MSSLSYEHPKDPFPKLLEGPQLHAVFEGEELGHPLIPESRSVKNSVRLGAATQLLFVSGSNMSGKSTLLRVVGINAVLALAGAPVRAKSLRMRGTPLRALPRVLGTGVGDIDDRANGNAEDLSGVGGAEHGASVERDRLRIGLGGHGGRARACRDLQREAAVQAGCGEHEHGDGEERLHYARQKATSACEGRGDERSRVGVLSVSGFAAAIQAAAAIAS